LHYKEKRGNIKSRDLIYEMGVTMCKAKEYTNQLTDILNNIGKDYNYYIQENRKTDLMIQDVLHKIEFDNFNAAEGYCLAKQIKDIRNDRRIYKNELETLQSLKMQLSPVMNTVKEVKNNIIKLEKKQKERIYKPRVLKEVSDNE
jgi:hypothetical protein